MKRATIRRYVPLFLALLLLVSAVAEGEELTREAPIRPAETGGPALLMRSVVAGLYVPMPTVETNIRLAVRGFVVRGTVKQTFENPTDQCIEALYVFPLPENSAVDLLAMTANGRRIAGEIREREEARQIYDSAKEQGRRASLLEQQRPNLFTVELSSLGPRESVEIEIGYQQILEDRDGEISVRVPLVAGPRYDPSRSNPESSTVEGRIDRRRDGPGGVRLEIALDAGFPVSEIASPTHAIEAVQMASTEWSISLAGAVPADRDFVLEWSPRLGSEPLISTFVDEVRRPDGAIEYFTLLAMMPQRERFLQSALSRELLIIIDTSGSMSGESLRQAKQAVSLALGRLNPADRFQLIEFNSVARPMTRKPLWADSDAIVRARDWIDGLNAQGGTEMLPALELALENQERRPGMIRQVIFLTDGMVSNERELARLVGRRIGESRLFPVGIGSAPNGHLLRLLARQGRGSVTHVDGAEDVSEAMEGLFRMIERPALTDVTVDHDDPGAEIYPRSIPDLYAGEPVLVTIRHSRPEAGLRVEGRIGSRKLARTLEPKARSTRVSGI